MARANLAGSILQAQHGHNVAYSTAPMAAPTPESVPSQDAPALSVVVIAYNEAECIEACLRELEETLERNEIDYELVLVDDGSTDATPDILMNFAARCARASARRQTNRGIGGALSTGFDAARGEYVTWLPADGQIDPRVVVRLFELRSEASFITTVYRTRDDAWYRLLISRSLNTLIRMKTGQVAKSGGNYLFRSTAWQCHRPADDNTMMLNTRFRQNVRAAGERVVEIEIDCRARMAGQSKVLNVRTILRTMRGLLGLDRGR